MKQAKRTIAANIAEKTGIGASRARKAVQGVLDCIKEALASGKKVDLGKKLGKLVIVERKPVRRIVHYLKGRRAKGQKDKTISTLYERHPRTVRLLGRGRDLSENPQPTVVTKNEKVQQKQTPVRKSFAIALPAWRRRFR